METQLPGWEALQVPAGRGGSSPPAAPSREGGWRVPGSCLWPLTKRQGCQRALMVRIRSLQHGSPDQPCTEAEPGFNHHSDKWETFMEQFLLCLRISVIRGMQELPCAQVTLLFAELRAAAEASLNEKYSKRKASLD